MKIFHWLLVGCVAFMLVTGCSDSSDPVPASSKLITAFSFAAPPSQGEIFEVNSSISVSVPYGTDLTALSPQITFTGVDVSPASDVAQNFTSPVTYTVTAENTTTHDYTVTVTPASIDAKKITAFYFEAPASSGSIIEDTHAIYVVVPFGSDLTALTPTIFHTGASISPISGAPQDFSSPVTFTVTAADSSTQDYTVSVTVAAADAKAITSFKFNNIPAEGIINETIHAINVSVPYGTDRSELIPTIQQTGINLSPESDTMHDFSVPFAYTVTAGDLTTQDYTVTVSVAAADSKSVLLFNTAAPFVTGSIVEGTHSISLTMPNGTDINSLTPHIIHSGTSISPALGTAQDFTSPAVYTVTAADNSTQDYQVTVDITPWATCGDYVFYAGQNYATVQVGSQCWFAENLNVGTQIALSGDQGTDCSNVKKYCYGDDPDNCSTFGGLYIGSQTVCGSFAESKQGICPAGWHVPSSPEYAVAINTLAGSNSMPDYGAGNPYQVWYASPAGDKMKATGLCQGRTPCADSGLDIPMNGEAYVGSTGWEFNYLNTHANLWTSSNQSGTEAYRICLAESNSGVCNTYYYSDFNQHAFAVRCVKD